MRPKVSAGVPVSGWQKGSPRERSIVSRTSSAPLTSLGRRARVGRERGDPLFKLGDRRSCLRFHAARRAFAATAYISTYFFADAVHEWSSRIARARSCSHGSPSALYRCSARPIASENVAASYFVNEKPL